MAFTPGQLTSSQAEELNRLLRDVAALKAMTATAPMTVERANGVPVISLKGSIPTSSDPEFDAQITARTPATIPSSQFTQQPGYRYSWRKVFWGPNLAVGGDPPGPFDQAPYMQVDPTHVHGVWNLRQNLNNLSPLPLAIGQVVRIKPMPGSSTWYVTDAVGSESTITLTYLVPYVNSPYIQWRTIKLAIRDLAIVSVLDRPYGVGGVQPPDINGFSLEDNPNLLGP